jgi:hypothetical protein
MIVSKIALGKHRQHLREKRAVEEPGPCCNYR